MNPVNIGVPRNNPTANLTSIKPREKTTKKENMIGINTSLALVNFGV